MVERILVSSSKALEGANAAATGGSVDKDIQFPLPAVALRNPTPPAFGSGRQEPSMHNGDLGGGPGSIPPNLHMTDEIPHLVEVTTRGEPEYERYRRGYTHPAVYETYDIPALKISFNPPPCPAGWQTFIHPEGMRYFFNDTPNLPVPVLTEAWIYDEAIYARLTEYMDRIYRFMDRNGVVFPRTYPSDLSQDATLYPQDLAPVVLVLEFKLSGNIGYYFVSHPTKALFWLDPFDFSEMLGEVHIKHTEWLVGLQMKSHYWTHNDYFPHLYELKHDDLEEVEDLLATAIGDAVTSSTATTGLYDLEQLKYLQTLLQRYEEKTVERRARIVGERRVLCRLLDNFYRQRFLNLYGERGARLDSTQSIHYSEYRRQKFIDPTARKRLPSPWYKRVYRSLSGHRPSAKEDEPITEDADPPIDREVKNMNQESVWMTILSLFMFGTTGMHIQKLREMTVDQIVSQQTLAKYSQSMVEEWRDVALYGTVMMGADMSFLSIGSVDESSSDGKASGPQRAVYFSLLTSLASVILSMLLLRQHREAMSITFIANRSNSRWGLESLALMYALPFALLIWSFIAFFICFAIVWYTSSDYAVITIASAVLLGSIVAIVWVAQAQYEDAPYESYLTTAVEWVKGLFDRDGPYVPDSASTLTKGSPGSSEESINARDENGRQLNSDRGTNDAMDAFALVHSRGEEDLAAGSVSQV